MRKGWPDVIVVTYILGALFFSGPSSSAWASEPSSPAIPEMKIDLRTERVAYLEWLRQSNENVSPPTPLSDAKCVARYGPGTFATGERGEGYWCMSVESQPLGALGAICALRFPDSEAAVLLVPEMVLICKAKGKAV